MRNLFYLFTLLFTWIFVTAQGVEWVHQYGGTGEEIVGGIAKDGEGNIYTTGFFTEEAFFGSPEGGSGLSAEGWNDMYVVKSSPEGELLWAKAYGASFSSSGSAIATDDEGNVFVAGVFVGEIDLNPEGAPHVLTSLGQENDFFLMKLDSDGNFLWARSMSGSAYGSITSIVIDDYQSINIIGHFYDTFSFEDKEGFVERTSRGVHDVFAAKYSQEGQLYWLHQFGGEGLEMTLGATSNQFSDLLVTGMFMGDAYLDDDLALSVESPGNNGVFLLRFNMMGEVIPTKIAEILDTDENSSVGMTYNIVTDDQDNVYVCGDFNPIIEFMPKENGEVVRLEAINNANPVGFVAKISNAGYLEWVNQIVPNSVISASVAYGIGVDAQENVYLSGYAGGDVQLGAFNITNDVLHSYLAKLNANGEFIYASQFGKSYFIEYSNNLILTSDNQLYLTGTFQDNVNINPHHGSPYEMNSRGYRDVYLLKTSVENLGTIQNELSRNSIEIYPNPSTGIYSLKTDKNLNGTDYNVFDMTGSRIFFGKISHNQLNLNTLDKGIYLLKIEGFEPEKIIKY